MRYVPLAMRMYRAALYWQMERDYAGFDIKTGKPIRDELKKENEAYVKRMAPRKYWDALIPKSEIGCKRKVLDTEYLSTLHKNNVELIYDDPVEEITELGVRTHKGQSIDADAIILATGFATQQMLLPMEIIGRDGLSLNKYVSDPAEYHLIFCSMLISFINSGIRPRNLWRRRTLVHACQVCLDNSIAFRAHAYLQSDFPNFFILMGPNTVTGHLSVIYTVECQINFVLRLITPIIQSLPSYRSRLLPSLTPSFLRHNHASIEVKYDAAQRDSAWTQSEAKKLVWASGCTNWAVDSKTGLNNMMYPDWQYYFWLRSIFWKKNDFVYRDSRSGKEVSATSTGKTLLWLLTSAALAGGVFMGKDWMTEELPRRLKDFDARQFLKMITETAR